VSWSEQNSGTPVDLYGVYFVDAQTGWAVGRDGTIIATQDGGANWKAQRSKTNEALIEVRSLDAHNAWVVGIGGSILATTDGGEKWQYQIYNHEDLRSAYFADARTGWVVGRAGSIFATRDGGTHWKKQVSGTYKDLTGVHFADAETGWAIGEAGTIVATLDGGANWQKQKSDTDKLLYSIYFADARTGWVVGKNGTLLATTDGGASWQPAGPDLWDVQFIDEETGWLVGTKGTILRTHDGGASWKVQKSGTDQDLLRVHFADGRTGWAVGTHGTILATTDGGANWRKQTGGTDRNFGGAYFTDAHTGWVVGENGTILTTRDGGMSWKPQQSGVTDNLEGVYFADGQIGWVVGNGGTILATKDGGANWTVQRSGTDRHLGRVHFVNERTGWAMAHEEILVTRDGGATWEKESTGTQEDCWNVFFANALTGWLVGAKGTILATRDGGRSWQAQRSSTVNDLHSVRFADSHTGWAVGENGTLLRTGPPTYAPWIDAAKVDPSAPGLMGTLDVSFALHNDSDVPIKTMTLLGRVGRAEWTKLGTSKKLDDDSGHWHVAWSPAEFGIHPGDTVDYQVRLDDGGPPLAPFQLRSFAYDPWLDRFWREHQTAIVSALGPTLILLSYAGVFGLVLVFAPARLARVGGAPGLDEVAKPSGTFGFLWELGRRALGHVTLPYLCRHPRVRRAWTQRYRVGRAKLSDLGKPARESFVTEPEVLDAWVQPRVQRVMAALDRLELFKQRRIYIELPLRVGDRQGGPIIERPSGEALRQYFAQQRTVVTIVGDGGSGKSTLACAVSRWAIADDPNERLAEHRMLPVFIVEDTTDLVRSVTRNLRRMLGDEELPDDLVRGLLAKRRLLVIVDALSERELATQQHIVQVLGEDVSLNAIVITSRTEPTLGAVDRTTRGCDGSSLRTGQDARARPERTRTQQSRRASALCQRTRSTV
jgi:photosystem II stability/assembly factor-like uncharacterized protein